MTDELLKNVLLNQVVIMSVLRSVAHRLDACQTELDNQILHTQCILDEADKVA